MITSDLKWGAYNGGLWLIAILGFGFNIAPATGLAAIIMWATLVMAFVVLFSEPAYRALRGDGKTTKMRWIDLTLDISLAAFAVANGYLATGFAYLLAVILINNSMYGTEESDGRAY